MLQYIIDAYKCKTEKESFWENIKKSEKLFKICFILIILGLGMMCISIFCVKVVLYLISLVLVLVSTVVYVILSDKKRRKNWGTNIKDYDESLDILRDVLKEEKINYYSKNKICVLMKKCKESIDELASEKERNKIEKNAFIDKIVVPIISFATGIASNGMSGKDAIIICILAIFVIVIFNFSAKQVSALVEEFEGNMIEERKFLYGRLEDLLVRDFED